MSVIHRSTLRRELLGKTAECEKYQSSFVRHSLNNRSIFIANCAHARLFTFTYIDVLTHVHIVNVYAQINPESCVSYTLKNRIAQVKIL